MNPDSRLLGWGVFLVALGAVPLAVATGLIGEDAVRGLWSLWPLLLIVLGIAFVARGSGLAPVAGLVASATAGVMIGGALAGGGLPFGACQDDRGASPFAGSGGELVAGAAMVVELGCGDLEVATQAGSAWRIEGSNENGQPPDIAATADAVRIGPSDDRSGIDLFRSRERWIVTIPTVPLRLEARVNAGRGTLDLAGATVDLLDVEANAAELRLALADVERVAALELQMNAGSATILLPDSDMEGRVSVNAGSIALCLPDGAGLRIQVEDNVTASNNFGARGLVRAGDAWETAGFASAQTQIVLDAEANAGSIELDPDDGCAAT